MLPARCLLALVFVGGGASTVGAQEYHLRGRVIANETLVPIVSTKVELLTPENRRIQTQYTDSLGVFNFALPRDDGYRLRATHAGFEQTLTPVLWTDAYGFIQVEIRLQTDAVLLAPLEIVARSSLHRSAVLDRVRDRIGTGFGRFITRDEIERWGFTRTSDVLRRFPGVRVEGSGRSSTPVIYLGRQNCPAHVFVDGMRVTTPDAVASGGGFISVDVVTAVSDIEVIEVFSGPGTTPAEFRMTTGGQCGVVAIWTRRGL